MRPYLLLLFWLFNLGINPVPAQESAENVINQAIKAAGYPTGKKPYHLTWREQGKMVFGGQELPYDATWAFEPSSKFRFDMNAEFGGQKMNIVFIQNGDKARESAMGTSQMLQGEKLEETTHSAYVFWINTLTPLVEEQGFTLKMLGDREFAGKPVVSIQVSRQGRRDVALHFDRKTRLLAGYSDRVKDEFQGWKEVPQETELFDYEKLPNGEMMYKGLIVKRDGKLLMQSKFSDLVRHQGTKPELFKLDEK